MSAFANNRRIATVTLVVADYDEAIRWYVEKLGFRLVEDADLGGGKRWVTVEPGNGGGARLLLARADVSLSGPDQGRQAAAIGNQAGGRVAFFLETDDFARDHAAMLARGVRFHEAPRHEPYGTVAVFADLHGNLWDLIEPKR
jgi:catechol 2,3-dioxygenase-like lactoylglutathione lyase family enzyme